jgi:hypothetical protein
LCPHAIADAHGCRHPRRPALGAAVAAVRKRAMTGERASRVIVSAAPSLPNFVVALVFRKPELAHGAFAPVSDIRAIVGPYVVGG